MATLWIRRRNSFGRESKESFTTWMKSSRFMLQHRDKTSYSHRVAAFLLLVILFFAAIPVFLVFFFVVFVVFPKPEVAASPSLGRLCVELFWTYSAHSSCYATGSFPESPRAP